MPTATEPTPDPNRPPTDKEKTHYFNQLLDYRDLLQNPDKYEKLLSEYVKLVELERDQRLKDVETERKATAAMAASRDLAIQQRDFYQNSYNVCVGAGKRSAGCWVKKFFTLWMAKCH